MVNQRQPQPTKTSAPPATPEPSPGPNEESKEPAVLTYGAYLDLMVSMRDQAMTYHHHKEMIAFTAATVYVGACFALASNFNDFKAAFSAKDLGTMCIFMCVSAFGFTVWQLRNRYLANKNVIAIERILCTELSKRPSAFGRYLPEDCRKIFPSKTHSTWDETWASICGAVLVVAAMFWATLIPADMLLRELRRASS